MLITDYFTVHWLYYYKLLSQNIEVKNKFIVRKTIMTDIISWLTVDNAVNEIMIDGSLKHTLKRAKKIKRRTLRLNGEWKKFGGRKTYKDYVRIKTDVLRNILDNDSTDYEPSTRWASAFVSSSSNNATLQYNGSNDEDDPLHCTSEEELEEQRSESKERVQKKSHPTITCTEIVTAKYMIIRDNEVKSIDEHRELSDYKSDQHSPDSKEIKKLHILSPEARHAGIHKHINSLYGNEEIDTSHDIDEEMLVTTGRRIFNKESSCSQVISDPSDGEESSPPRPLQTSDVVPTNIVQTSEVCREQPVKKSIKSQIAEQEFVDSNNETTITRDKRKSVADSVTDGVPSDADSLRYVLQNLCSTSNKHNDEYSSMDEIEYSLKPSTSTRQWPMKVLPRPMGLQQFIDQERLIPTLETSTINIDDIETTREQDGDEEVWLMEIPRSIAMDGQLCGKQIVLKGKKMTIGDGSYKPIVRHDKSVSCILSVGKAEAQFKTVNLRPVGSIVVRQESYETDYSPLASSVTSLRQSLAVQTDTTGRTRGLVPFPNNLKTRNPLVA